MWCGGVVREINVDDNDIGLDVGEELKPPSLAEKLCGTCEKATGENITFTRHAYWVYPF
jgi:hypothetical protein